MEIFGFDSFVQLWITICAAYVAIGYSDSFVKVLTEKIFPFKTDINERYTKLMSLIDDNSLSSISEDREFMEDHEMLYLIEEAKVEFSKIESLVEEKRAEIDRAMEDSCMVHGFSVPCIYFSLSGILLLITMGYCEGAVTSTVAAFWSGYSVITLILMIVFWTFVIVAGYRRKRILTSRNNYLGVLFFGVAFVVSFLLTFFCRQDVGKAWMVLWPADVFYPMANFIVCAGVVFVRSMKCSKMLNAEYSKVKENCDSLNDKIGRIKTTYNTLRESKLIGERKAQEDNALPDTTLSKDVK